MCVIVCVGVRTHLSLIDYEVYFKLTVVRSTKSSYYKLLVVQKARVTPPCLIQLIKLEPARLSDQFTE